MSNANKFIQIKPISHLFVSARDSIDFWILIYFRVINSLHVCGLGSYLFNNGYCMDLKLRLSISFEVVIM